MNIPLVDLKAQYKDIKSEIDNAIQNSLDRTDFIIGEDVKLFEQEFAKFTETSFAIGVATGTDALKLILKALCIGAGDEVLMPSNTFIVIVYVTSDAGAVPVFVDIDENTYNLDIERVAEKITPKIKAIMPVHLYGRPVDMKSLMKIAKDKNIFVIEDSCQAHGAVYEGKKVGGFGNASAFSFYPGKNLGAYGDGGLVATNDKDIAHSIEMQRNYGQSKKYHHDVLGYNSRLDTLQAAILRVKLTYLDKWNNRRREIADLYRTLLKDAPVILPADPKDCVHVYHIFAIRTEKRDKLLAYLNENGIGAGIHYPVPIHLQKAYSFLGYKKGDFPVSEKVSNEVLSLPMYPEMTDDKAVYVADKIKAFFT